MNRSLLLLATLALGACTRSNPAPAATTPTPSTPAPTTPTTPTSPTTPTTPSTPTPTHAAGTAFRVDSPAHEGLLQPGDAAPRFRVLSHDERVIENNGTLTRPLVIYFYPRDETPGCTVEAHGFRDTANEYASAGVDVVGVSTDSNDSHRGFASGHQLPFALLSDPDGQLAAAFGVGVTAGFAQRVTFVIDKSGRIVKTFENVTPSSHAGEVLTIARGLRG